MGEPTAGQIARFLEAFDVLNRFEATTRATRGYGVFSSDQWPEMPDPSVMAVKSWLQDKAAAQRDMQEAEG